SRLPEERLDATLATLKTRTVRPAKEIAEKIVESTSINLAFAGSPAVARRILNQFGAAKDHFYVLRTLVVKNQVDRGPTRRAAEPSTRAPESRGSGTGAKAKEAGIAFIVGTEHVDVAAKVEIVKFSLPDNSIR